MPIYCRCRETYNKFMWKKENLNVFNSVKTRLFAKSASRKGVPLELCSLLPVLSTVLDPTRGVSHWVWSFAMGSHWLQTTSKPLPFVIAHPQNHIIDQLSAVWSWYRLSPWLDIYVGILASLLIVHNSKWSRWISGYGLIRLGAYTWSCR